jgi:flavin reductase (DIM6/NTAB) family NADH-FMN oxidoreductase RutF
MAVDLPWGDPRTAKFTTGVGLITSNGPHGHNIMPAEWTHPLSYSPGIISVHIGFGKATGENIEKTKVFGVNMAASDQNVLSSLAGNHHGKEFDKIGALKELGFRFFPAKKIDVLLVEGSALNCECRLIEQKTVGDHIMFIGEIVELYPANEKPPLVYNNTKYSAPGPKIHKPPAEELERFEKAFKKFTKK